MAVTHERWTETWEEAQYILQVVHTSTFNSCLRAGFAPTSLPKALETIERICALHQTLWAEVAEAEVMKGEIVRLKQRLDMGTIVRESLAESRATQRLLQAKCDLLAMQNEQQAREILALRERPSE